MLDFYSDAYTKKEILVYQLNKNIFLAINQGTQLTLRVYFSAFC